MKPLKFKDVSPNRILNYEAMSKIRGGIDDEYGGVGMGTCGIKYTIDNFQTVILCNMSQERIKETAELLVESNVPYWWCCDSCPTTSYCGNGSDGY